MSKKEIQTTKPESAFERFQQFAKALVSVPKKEIQEKIEKHNQTKSKQIHRRGIS